MKRVFLLLLCMCMLFLTCACTTDEGGNATERETVSATESKPDTISAFAGIVADPHSWYEEYSNLPVANDQMTTEELRQICVDYFKLQLSFTWTPNRDINYTIANMNDRPASLPSGIAYSGLCYAAGGGRPDGKGNLDKILQYYDKQTGVLDIIGMGEENYLAIIGSCCSWGPCWAWHRVSNTLRTTGMEHYNYLYGALPVGSYTYIPQMYDWTKREASKKIIELNGANTMLESYAQILPGDGLYSSPSWHITMCSVAPVVVRNPDGTINPDESYLYICEQGWAEKLPTITQSNGVTLMKLGTVDVKRTFRRLLDTGYIPFTCPEFVGQDPVEPGEAWLGNQYEPYANGEDFTLAEISQRSIWANYVISTFRVEIKDPSGKVLFAEEPYVYTRNSTFSISMVGLLDHQKLSAYANGENTIHLYVKLSNGELVEAFHAVLKN